MPTVHLPSALAGHSGGRRHLQIDGTTVGKVLAALRRHVNVFVNGESIRYLGGVETPVGDADEVWILPAVSGG
jgi:molybdopterin synthase sulfur carrier subunit